MYAKLDLDLLVNKCKICTYIVRYYKLLLRAIHGDKVQRADEKIEFASRFKIDENIIRVSFLLILRCGTIALQSRLTVNAKIPCRNNQNFVKDDI